MIDSIEYSRRVSPSESVDDETVNMDSKLYEKLPYSSKSLLSTRLAEQTSRQISKKPSQHLINQMKEEILIHHRTRIEKSALDTKRLSPLNS